MPILKIWDGSAFIEVPILDGVPGGELGGTWAVPTVDPTHAGSAHLSLKTSKSVIYASPSEDLAVEDWLSGQAVRVPAAGKHGTWTPGTIYVRVGTAGTGTNTILFRTSTTLTGARTTRATVNLGTAREASAAITWTPADGEYLWVAVSAVGATAPKLGIAQVDIEETVYL